MSEQANLLIPPAKAGPLPDVYALLRKRHADAEWVLVEEVAPNTGGGTRYADAVAINLWSSRGHSIIGYEVKVSRSDWLRELKKPEKAEQSVFRFCDHWFVVAPKGIVKTEELPPTWGLLEASGTTLRVTVPGPRLAPQPVTRGFFASLVRRAFESIDRRALALVEGTLRAEREKAQERVEAEVNRRTRGYAALEASMAKFTAATGLAMDPWGGPPIETIKLAQKLEALSSYDREHLLGRISALANEMERLVETMRKAVADTEGERHADPT